MTLKLIKKYAILLATLLVTLAFAVLYFQTYNTNYKSHVSELNQSFFNLDKKLDNALRYKSENLLDTDLNTQWSELDGANDINIHIYRNDSLKYWNTNQLPIIRFAEIHFPAEGILHLQNGWYYAKIKEVDDYLICASSLIKHDFAYQNKDLINDFQPGMYIPFPASINIGEENGYSVFDKNKEYLFSVVPDEDQAISSNESALLACLLLAVIVFWLFSLSFIRKNSSKKISWLLPAGVVGLRAMSLYFGWFAFMSGNEIIDPSLYGSNSLFPNLLEYLINISIIVYLFGEISHALKTRKRKLAFKIVGYVAFVGSFLIWTLILNLTKGLIENSTISMVVDELFKLNIYSVLAIVSLGVLFYSYFRLLVSLIKFCFKNDVQITHITVIGFIVSCIYFYFEINDGYQILLPALFPAILYGVAIYVASKEKSSQRLAIGLFMLFLFSLVMSSSFEQLNHKKERGDRELYANQLATEKSIGTEIEYSIIAKEIVEDKFLQRFISNPFEISSSDFQENLERRIFNGYWERYEMNFSFYDSLNSPYVDNTKAAVQLYAHLEEIINTSGTVSEVDPGIFFINDYRDQFSYIIKQKIIAENGNSGTLYCTLKSKKIPEEIGFPRLLISSDANVIESLESYSIARYRKGKLLTKYGEFNFPSAFDIMSPKDSAKNGFINYGGYNHYLLKKSDNNVVVLSLKNESWVDSITSFSYLFSFYGFLLLPLLFRTDKSSRARRTLSLAMKIQIVLISLVFLSLLAFGWGSGVFVSNQYNEFTNDVIREKLSSVEKEVKAKLGDFNELSIDDNGDYMQHYLQKFAKVFFTDINLYDADGYLLATSRPKVFNMGLISEQMNPVAYKNLKYGQRSEFVQQEHIGNLNYSSAYQPFYNRAGKKLAFINLQHFGQQREFENQIEKFLVAIVNVFILLLAVSIILAILISNWLTSPLRILQENFAHVRFGHRNERISYDKEDEIGSLVKEYNQKLDELEYTAEQLAKSERESAWREMAKQVAHEIKNPLTPMKLSVQQLLRSFDPSDPKSKDKLERVANSMIEQIDALTKIANEFSNFAKMPNPTEEKLNIIQLISSIKEVFAHKENVQLVINTGVGEAFVRADKDQMVRVFNNLIKNAIQSIPEDVNGLIRIDISVHGGQVNIEVIDNGVGIASTEHSKIFVPYFTTKSTGTGLGLAMVKQILENHQGTIDFESELNKGTTFIITLPIVE